MSVTRTWLINDNTVVEIEYVDKEYKFFWSTPPSFFADFLFFKKYVTKDHTHTNLITNYKIRIKSEDEEDETYPLDI